MAALPYIQLYVADYLADTIHLSTEEHGAYLLLLMNYWQTGKPIPKNRLASAARLSNERWTDVERTLNEYFTEDENGAWFNARLEADLKHVKNKSLKASRAGKASAKKRRGSQDIDNKHVSNERSTSVIERTLNPPRSRDTDTDTDKDIKKNIKKKNIKKKNIKNPIPNGRKKSATCFDEFWSTYPKKTQKKNCLEKWKLKNLDEIGQLIAADVTCRIKDDVQWQDGYIPNPLTYINQERWQDEIQTTRPKSRKSGVSDEEWHSLDF